MNKIAIVADSNSSILPDDAKNLGIHLLNMPFMVNGKEYIENQDITYDEFFEMLADGAEVSTSQPSPASLLDTWDSLLKEYEEIVYIPMSSGLSGSCDTATALSADYDGRVVVVNNQRISATQRQSAIDAKKLAEKGLSAKEIKEKLEEDGLKASIYIAVNTLELLKKSGRVTPAAAAFANALNLKPVLTIQGEKLDAYQNVRGMKKAEKAMLTAMEKDMKERFAGKKFFLFTAYTGPIEPANEWLAKVREYFHDDTIQMFPLPLSISCHTGSGVKAIGLCEISE